MPWPRRCAAHHPDPAPGDRTDRSDRSAPAPASHTSPSRHPLAVPLTSETVSPPSFPLIIMSVSSEDHTSELHSLILISYDVFFFYNSLLTFISLLFITSI